MGVVHRVAVASHTTGYRCKEAIIDGGQCVLTCLHEQLLLDATFGYSCYCSTFFCTAVIWDNERWTGKCFDESGPGEGERLGCAASLEML